ncbi:RNA polymerase sigma factor [Rhodoferax sp. AJA081-3]|uniref:RNA polymerase sigma factor n=1 Tax=Rhodoferax sp. AJA081-3 TaxID=2752316 RepID=UPI001ADFF9F0|nr:RNA polymerase sigma factor [Rhodoferax sp. AJA081-3]QTN27029.1 RNA polymerase sigma factor [Rhodoferax sp. AJA081-3]
MSTAHTTQAIETVYRRDARRVFATLVRLLGDFDLAEEALHEAFRAALEQWPAQGVPGNPSAWLVSAGRFKAIDSIRRQARFTSTETMDQPLDAIADETQPAADASSAELEDDSLRLIFTCCHPALAPDAQVALTLREVCGLTTEEIARAYLTPAPTLAQRIVRAKAKIRDAKIPYRVPEADELAARMPSVLRVLYLVFNEGYSPSSGALLTRADLSQEAIRLTRLIATVLPPPPLAEVHGLLALMLLHESRRAARTDGADKLIPLEEQDRTRWNADLIAEGCALVEKALHMPGIGPYALQAGISAVHAEAQTADQTDWAQIVGLYDELLRMEPSPVVALNRAVAVAMHAGCAQGIALVDELLTIPAMQEYHLAHAARADLCRRLQRWDEARASYQAALARVQLEPERRFLERRLSEIAS